jgi:hypothetical protein
MLGRRILSDELRGLLEYRLRHFRNHVLEVGQGGEFAKLPGVPDAKKDIPCLVRHSAPLVSVFVVRSWISDPMSSRNDFDRAA